jgi:hypothetical protein
MQEPASVILSIGNLLAHWRGLQLVRRRVPRANGLGGWLRLAAGVHINTWIWSAVFHTRGELSYLEL